MSAVPCLNHKKSTVCVLTRNMTIKYKIIEYQEAGGPWMPYVASTQYEQEHTRLASNQTSLSERLESSYDLTDTAFETTKDCIGLLSLPATSSPTPLSSSCPTSLEDPNTKMHDSDSDNLQNERRDSQLQLEHEALSITC